MVLGACPPDLKHAVLERNMGIQLGQDNFLQAHKQSVNVIGV